jgi:lipoyl(octanoyl) transferase
VTPPWLVLGETSWREALALQEDLRARVQAGDAGAETILFTWHRPVVTVGKHADLRHLRVREDELTRLGIGLEQARRGGDVTVHGPGQLVIYPVVRLRRGVAAHVRALGETVAGVLAELGLRDARCSRDPLGVFVGARKIAAIGVHVSRGVSMHGLALNVGRESLPLFELVVPCGLHDVEVTCVADELTRAGMGAPPSLTELASRIAPALARVLDLRSPHGSIG